MTTIAADPVRCVGAGQCVLTDPDALDQSELDGTVAVLGANPRRTDDKALKRARVAVEICPSRALSLKG